MGTRRRTCPWFKRDGIWVVIPNWHKDVEISFTSRNAMVEWARGKRVMLKFDARRGQFA